MKKYAHLIGHFDEAVRRACHNFQLAKLYELIALASVVQYEIQSTYPYIDYRAEMKTMNATYKPLQLSSPANGRLVILWTSDTDETTTKQRSNNDGFWSPNHFVPLVKCDVSPNPFHDHAAITILAVGY